jgi:hypothetical protein
MFNHPTAIALDVHGNVYVAKPGNLRIYKITPAREVTMAFRRKFTGKCYRASTPFLDPVHFLCH